MPNANELLWNDDLIKIIEERFLADKKLSKLKIMKGKVLKGSSNFFSVNS